MSLPRNLMALAAATAVAGCSGLPDPGEVPRSQPTFATIDVHTHTWYTDGLNTLQEVADNAIVTFKLDMFANSEHGGLSGNSAADGAAWLAVTPAVTPLGDSATSANAPLRDTYAAAAPGPYGAPTAIALWRWQVLRDFSWPLVKSINGQTAIGGKILQGVEWNVPSHEHASVAIVGTSSAKPIADFEFMFDASDKDNSRNGTRLDLNLTSGGTTPVSTTVAAEVDLFGNSLSKKYKTHSDSVAGVAYLQKNFKDTSYFLLNHPSRSQAYTAADLRDFTIAGPDVAVGLEGFPGHQKEGPAGASCRGGYNRMYDAAGKKVSVAASADAARTARARTFGGADWMLGKVGGLMDSLWAEGRRFWVFVNSDYHEVLNDFWPGEYARSYVGVGSKSQADIVKGMKAGNVFIVHGDLINALDFRVKAITTDGINELSAFMGENATFAKGQDVRVVVRFKSPATNNNGDAVSLDHVDVISGSLGSKSNPGDSGYTKETSDAAVVARIPRSAFAADGDGFLAAEISVPLDKSKYLRLRGTNHAIGSPLLDADGNPLQDEPTDAAACANDAAKAWADLWFYSNPIFLTAK
jgi:hypothetical protein